MENKVIGYCEKQLNNAGCSECRLQEICEAEKDFPIRWSNEAVERSAKIIANEEKN